MGRLASQRLFGMGRVYCPNAIPSSAGQVRAVCRWKSTRVRGLGWGDGPMSLAFALVIVVLVARLQRLERTDHVPAGGPGCRLMAGGLARVLGPCQLHRSSGPSVGHRLLSGTRLVNRTRRPRPTRELAASH